MTRKKILAAEVPATVRIRINRSFNGMYKGDEATVPLDAVVQSWVRAGLAVVVGGIDAPGKAGQGRSAPDDAGSKPTRTRVDWP